MEVSYRPWAGLDPAEHPVSGLSHLWRMHALAPGHPAPAPAALTAQGPEVMTAFPVQPTRGWSVAGPLLPCCHPAGLEARAVVFPVFPRQQVAVPWCILSGPFGK